MSYETKQQIIKRSKSLMWRLGMMIIAFLLTGFLEQILPLLEISSEMKVFIGLIGGEITKYLNRYNG